MISSKGSDTVTYSCITGRTKVASLILWSNEVFITAPTISSVGLAIHTPPRWVVVGLLQSHNVQIQHVPMKQSHVQCLGHYLLIISFSSDGFAQTDAGRRYSISHYVIILIVLFSHFLGKIAGVVVMRYRNSIMMAKSCR